MSSNVSRSRLKRERGGWIEALGVGSGKREEDQGFIQEWTKAELNREGNGLDNPQGIRLYNRPFLPLGHPLAQILSSLLELQSSSRAGSQP